MTRINVGIPVKNLTDEHLLAEHREIKRIPNTWRSELANNIPTTFRFGPGHVKFFYDKLEYLFVRSLALHAECQRRGFSVDCYAGSFLKHRHQLLHWKSYEPTDIDANLTIDRIAERIATGKLDTYHYYGKRLSKTDAIQLLKQSLC